MTDASSIPAIFNFDAETGEYMFASLPDRDPLVNDRFLVPANATMLPPPEERQGFTRRFVDGAWGYSPAGDAETPPTEEPVVTAAMVDAARDIRIASGFGFNGHVYQTRPEDRENIAGAATAALAAMVNGAQPGDVRWHGGDSDFEWIAADNSTHPLDAQTTFAMGQAAMAHKQAHIFAARTLKDMEPIPADFATNDAYWPIVTPQAD
ncbi:hypothetical protein EN41_13870 [Agrobacterium tumefaciens]|uniref:DUF4376 domain-containing protein n=1 Tax=Agrobacterium fabrum TaxID=1176649 RepID=UPI0004D4A695|nr:DUF4376 domain-containing protein [Agrobacterium fabrum]KEY54873.1 hypothetical protein EN41_13870 [Agrobacterium tumefaciens]MCX2877391.1 DUF4376 domain-containing protein [Agrobacterium fabrum]NMV68850.1 DUF4376 domain-containing protein [Agrobacterium fabrum]QQN10927.1 DUF4376 domain-containing protein [Agrobacterium fabrum]TRB31553.1 DUF4376 domain-containing protein [Agrobacterium fabrum]